MEREICYIDFKVRYAEPDASSLQSPVLFL
jgi:hypothetical protein